MIFKECLPFAVSTRVTAIAGHLVGAGIPSGALPLLAVRAFIADTTIVIGESPTTSAGEFRLETGVPPPTRVRLQLIDADNVVIAETDVEISDPVHAASITVTADRLEAARPVLVEGPPPSLLHHASIAALRSRVQSLIEVGTLDTAASRELERGIAPLLWADSLMTDARGVLAGNIDAADRLRAALLSLGAPAVLPNDIESTFAAAASTNDLETRRDDSDRIVNRSALAQIASAVAWSVDDRAEGQAMLNGLAAVLWSSPWLELLLRASAIGAAPMQPLMSGPGGGWGLPPGLTGGSGLPPGLASGGSGVPPGLAGGPLPDPGLPAPPGGLPPGGLPPVTPGGLPPGWGYVPRPKGDKIPGKLGDLVPDYKVPINQMPSEEEKCLIGAMAAVAIKKRSLPQYEIRAIDDPEACEGMVVLLTGINFGTGGRVIFPGKGDGVAASDVLSWTDTAIRVRVPNGAAPGVIRLSIYEGSLCLCGRRWPLYRIGRTLPLFDGGLPVVLNVNVNGMTSAITVEPGESVTVTFTTSVGPGVTVQMIVTNGATTVFDSGSLPGGFHSLTFTAPGVRSPTTIDVEIRGMNRCGVSREHLPVLLVKQPRLRILKAEVTQAIQRLDNSVRLGANRRTMVRVYIDSGLDLFSFGANPSNLPGVSGSIVMWRGNQRLALVTPLNAPFTTFFTFFPGARQSLSGSLNFMLPVEHLAGDLRLEISIRLDTFPAGVTAGANTSTSMTVNVKFELLKKVSLVRIMLADDWRNLPAPTVAEWQTALQGAMTRFPIADNGWEIRIHPGHTVVTVDRDLSDDDGWGDLLEDLDDVAGDSDDSWDHRWVGLLPAYRNGIDTFTTRGMARTETTDRPWPLSNDYLVMACVAGRPEVFAHELGHTVGIGHANCPPGKPDDVDNSLPSFIEEPGIDLYAMQPVMEFTTGELMGYCSVNGLWPSIVTWHRFIEGLD